MIYIQPCKDYQIVLSLRFKLSCSKTRGSSSFPRAEMRGSSRKERTKPRRENRLKRRGEVCQPVLSLRYRPSCTGLYINYSIIFTEISFYPKTLILLQIIGHIGLYQNLTDKGARLPGLAPGQP